MIHNKDSQKDTQKSVLLFVFALGIIFTYLASLFLPLPYTKKVRESKAFYSSHGTDMGNNDTQDDMNTSFGSDAGMEDGTQDMTTMMNSMTSVLEGKTGADFDKTFLEQMIAHHEGAVAMAKMAFMNSHNANVLTLSKNIIMTQEKEIADMKKWQEEASFK